MNYVFNRPTGDELNEAFREALAKSAKELYERIMANREALIQAWVAETGCLPSESVLCQQTVTEDGKVIVKMWVEKSEPSFHGDGVVG